MKILPVSDLHLDFTPITINNCGADVLIVAGDLGELRSPNFVPFFQSCSDNFEKTFFVPGNHEFYGGRIDLVKQKLAEIIGKFPNITLLDDYATWYKGYQFVGGTLWTDCNKMDPMTLHALKNMMWDFTGIRKPNGLHFSPADSVDFHHKTMEYFDLVLGSNTHNRCIVVTHHSPCMQSVHERYRHDVIMNGGFHSDLSEFILDRPQIKLWIHGHTHFPFDYMLGETRIVCNPRGYTKPGWKEHDGFNPEKIIELENIIDE